MLYPARREARDALRDDQPVARHDDLLQHIVAMVGEPMLDGWPR